MKFRIAKDTELEKFLAGVPAWLRLFVKRNCIIVWGCGSYLDSNRPTYATRHDVEMGRAILNAFGEGRHLILFRGDEHSTTTELFFHECFHAFFHWKDKALLQYSSCEITRRKKEFEATHGSKLICEMRDKATGKKPSGSCPVVALLRGYGLILSGFVITAGDSYKWKLKFKRVNFSNYSKKF